MRSPAGCIGKYLAWPALHLFDGARTGQSDVCQAGPSLQKHQMGLHRSRYWWPSAIAAQPVCSSLHTSQRIVRQNQWHPAYRPKKKHPKPSDAIDAPDAGLFPATVSAGRQAATSRRVRRMVAKVFLAWPGWWAAVVAIGNALHLENFRGDSTQLDCSLVGLQQTRNGQSASRKADSQRKNSDVAESD